jgi:hypothetical protein
MLHVLGTISEDHPKDVSLCSLVLAWPGRSRASRQLPAWKALHVGTDPYIDSGMTGGGNPRPTCAFPHRVQGCISIVARAGLLFFLGLAPGGDWDVTVGCGASRKEAVPLSVINLHCIMCASFSASRELTRARINIIRAHRSSVSSTKTSFFILFSYCSISRSLVRSHISKTTIASRSFGAGLAVYFTTSPFVCSSRLLTTEPATRFRFRSAGYIHTYIHIHTYTHTAWDFRRRGFLPFSLDIFI